MKKNCNLGGYDLFRPSLLKLLGVMKLMLVLICGLGLLSSYGKSYSQNSKLTIDLRNSSIEGVLNYIENQTEYSFMYDNKKIDVDRKVDISVKNRSIDEVLSEIFNGELEYQMIGKHVIITPSKGKFSGISRQFEGKVTGKVTDSSGMPLPGVTIIIKGTTTGTVTDNDGNYFLGSVNENATLVFSFVGMQTKEVNISGRTSVDISLEEESIGLEEVVAIGYGTREKKDLTGAVSQISSDELQKEIRMSPELAMQGKMAGVFISNPGSDPNARPTIRIRGVSTLGYNDPLYVVDGIPLTEGAAGQTEGRLGDLRGNVNVLNMINPNDIESISVLKDASATAIYGVRASNGVILITTKRGSKGKMSINLSAKYGVQNIYKDYDVLSTQQYVNMHQEAWDNNTEFNEDPDILRFYDPNSPEYLGNNPTYDWQSEGKVKNAAIQDYNVNISGGNEVSNYSVGTGYSSQENALFSDSFERYSFFMNSDHQLASWLKVGESYRLAYTKSDFNGGSDAFAPPWQPLYDPNGFDGYALPGKIIDGEFVSRAYGNSTRDNFLGNAEYETRIYNLMRNMGSFYAEVSPLKGLRVKGTFSFDYYTNGRENYEAVESGLFAANQGVLLSSGNTYTNRETVNSNIVKEFLVGYNNSFGKHNVDIVLNAMDQRVGWNIKNVSIRNNSPITSWDQRRVDEGWPAEDKGSFYERNRSGLLGYMGRLSYNFNSKYYLDATVRRDGTSKFGSGYKWGTFPSFAAAWRISSEPFMENVSWLDDLKIRGGWGETGNQETKDYAFLSLVNFNPKYSTGDGGSAVGDGVINPAAALGDFPVVDMSWENVTTTTLGFDAILLNNKVSFTAEYYNRMTDGILQTISIPLVIGALNNPVVNLAKVENSGFEFQAGYNDRFGEIGFNASFNFTTVKNEVRKLYLGRPQGGTLRIEEGQSMNYIYGYKVGGIFQTPEEVEAWKAEYTDPGRDSQKAPGDMYFQDLNSAPDPEVENQWVGPDPDGKVDDFDRTYLGKTIPGYYYGLNFGFDYKEWDLSLNFRGVGDVQKINDVRRDRESLGAGGANFLFNVLDRWTSSNPSTTMPRAIAGDPSGNNRMSDRWVEDAGFFRLQNLQIGYTVDAVLLSEIGINSVRCYLSGSNLFVVTPYSGLDPEDDTTPLTVTAGVNINF